METIILGNSGVSPLSASARRSLKSDSTDVSSPEHVLFEMETSVPNQSRGNEDENRLAISDYPASTHAERTSIKGKASWVL